MDRVIRIVIDPSGATQGGNVVRRELGRIDQAISSASSSQDGFTSGGRDGFRDLLPEVEGVSDTFTDLTRGAADLDQITDATSNITDGFSEAATATNLLNAANDDTAIGLAQTAESLASAADGASDFVSASEEFEDITERLENLASRTDDFSDSLGDATADGTVGVSRLRRAFGTLGRGVLIIGGIAAGLAALAVAAVATSEETRGLFRELGTDLIDLGRTTVSAVRVLLGPVGDLVNDAVSGAAGLIRDATSAIAEFAGIDAVNVRVERFNEGLREGTQIASEFRIGLGDSFDGIEQSLARTRAQIGLTVPELLALQTGFAIDDSIIDTVDRINDAIQSVRDAQAAKSITDEVAEGRVQALTAALKEQGTAVGDEARFIIEAARATGELIEEQERLNAAVSTFNSLQNDRGVFEQQIEDLILLRDTIGPTQISIEEFRDAVLEAQRGLNLEEITRGFTELQQIANAGARDIQGVFADFLFDPIETGFDGMVRNFAEALRRMASEALASSLFSALFGERETGGLGGIIGGLFGREHGGGVRGGQTVLVGENGPELFTPQNAGSVIPNPQTSGFAASMMQSAPPQVNVTLVNTIDKAEIAGVFQDGTGDTILMNRFSARQRAFQRAIGV